VKAEARFEAAWLAFRQKWIIFYFRIISWVIAVSLVGYLSRHWFDMDVLTILTLLGFYIPVRRAAMELAGFKCPRCKGPFFGGQFTNVWNHRCVACQLKVWSNESEDEMREKARHRPRN
jgi:hypothetical protein